MAAYTYLDGAKGQELLGLLDRNRVHGVGFLENGARSFTSCRPLRRPEDLKGQKIRVMESPVYIAIVRALGATPVPIPYPELPRALQQRVVDGQENPPVNVYSARLFLWQPYMVTDRHAYHAFVFAVNGEVWSGLGREVQGLIEAAFVEVQDFQRASTESWRTRKGADMGHGAAKSFVKGVHGVRYQVKDVARATAFYTQQLGFELEHQQPPAFASVSLGGVHILLSGPGASGSRPMPNGQLQEPGGWNRIVLRVSDLPGFIAELKEAGVRFRNELETGPGGRQIQIEDADGNPIELFEPARRP